MNAAASAEGRARARGTAFELSSRSAQRCEARGALTFATARRAWAQGLAAQHAAGDALVIDCGAVEHADSAGLAVLLDWLAEAKRAGRSLRYEHLPEGLLRLAHISAVDEMLQQGV